MKNKHINCGSMIGAVRKILIFMRILFILTFVCVLQIQAVNTYSQSTILSLKKNDAKATLQLVDLFKQIEKQSEFLFNYKDSDIKNLKSNVKVTEGSVYEILDKALAGTDLTYSVNDRHITIAKTEKIAKIGQSSDDRITVSGIVTDISLEPLIGVSLSVKGQALGTVTDMDGRFSLKFPAEGGTLVVSYIGYTTQEIKVQSASQLSIKLLEDLKTLDEVVVVGYGVQKKMTLSGAIANIKGEDIIKTKNSSLAVSLAGKVPGLQIRQQTGMPGDFNTSINIRGFGNPLFVIDGVVRDGDKEFQRLNPEEIESISVLKDASAAIYGLNSGNGVIIVKTKDGSQGPLRITYGGMVGLSTPTKTTPMMNVRQFEEIRNEAEINAGRSPYWATKEELEKQSNMPYTDWYKETFKKSAWQQQHNLTLEGGSEKISTFINLGFVTDNGLLKSGDVGYDRYSLRSNTKLKIIEGLTATVNVGGYTDKRYQPGVWDDAFFYLMKAAHGIIPSETVYANNNPDYWNRPSPIMDNPVAFSRKDEFGYREWRGTNIQASVDVSYNMPFLKGLTAKVLGSYDNKTENFTKVQKNVRLYTHDVVENEDVYTGHSTRQPSIQDETRRNIRVNFQGSLAYTTTIANAHNLSGVMVFEAKEENERYLSGKRIYDYYTIDNIDRAPIAGQEAGGWTDKRTFLSQIGRFNYNYKEKYLVEFAYRYDGSYRYHPDERWGLFPVGSAAWRLSEEDFFKNKFPFITNLKFRGSYGVTGQNAGSPHQYIAGFKSRGSYVMNDGKLTNGFGVTGLTNDALTWFKSKTADVGFDLTVLNGLVDFQFDLYRRNREGLLRTRVQALPNTFGENLPDENLEKDRTEGVEFMIGHRNKIDKVNYGVNMNFNFARSKWIYRERAPFRSSWDKYRHGEEGRWMDIGWGQNVIGQYQNYDEIRNSHIATTDRGNNNTLPGDWIHEDTNGDGIIDGKDVQPLFWNGQPKMHFGMTMNADWNGFDINVLWQGSAKNTARFTEILGNVLTFGGNSPEFYYDRWHLADPYDPNSKWIPGYWPATRKNDYDAGAIRQESNKNRFNALYLRLKSLEIGYTVPKQILQPRGIHNVRVYLNGFNLITFSNSHLKNLDPEMLDGNGFNYPLSRSYNLGVNITF